MECASMESRKVGISLASCLVVLLCIGTWTLVRGAYGSRVCVFDVIFNFGDSNSDTGGAVAASLESLNPPYGLTFFHAPAGRFSDGRLIIDFIAQSFGLSYLNPYLDSLESNFTCGANFATSSSTITLPTSIKPQGRFSPFYLDVHYSQFKRFILTTHSIRNQGGIFASLMPKIKSLGEALYTFDIGQNDIAAGFYDNKTVEQVNASVPYIINAFSTNVKNIYKLGGRWFWIHNTGPIGCLPYMLTLSLSAERDACGCAKPHNEVAQYFNLKLKEAIIQLRKDLPLAAITYVDIYSVKYSLFTNPNKYGFDEKALMACCGYGREYNFGDGGCGDTIIVNGSERVVGSCENVSVSVVWDGVHYTEAANKFTFEQISSGAFSDPPLPLNMACHAASNIHHQPLLL